MSCKSPSSPFPLLSRPPAIPFYKSNQPLTFFLTYLGPLDLSSPPQLHPLRHPQPLPLPLPVYRLDILLDREFLALWLCVVLAGVAYGPPRQSQGVV